jgi:hypothetical protein
MPQSRRQKLASRFRKILPVEDVIDQPTSLTAYECDSNDEAPHKNRNPTFCMNINLRTGDGS